MITDNIIKKSNLNTVDETKKVEKIYSKIRNSQKCKVYLLETNKYLVSSSKGDATYEVNSTIKGNELKYVCNCGNEFNEKRTTCKHVYSVLFHNLKSVITEDVNKPINSNISHNLQMYHVNKKLSKIGL